MSSPGNEARETDDMELSQLESPEDNVKLPLHEDIMQLAARGELGPVQKLLDEGRYSIDYKDREGITPLHVWHERPHLYTQQLINVPIVGRYQQSLRLVQVPDRKRSRSQHQRRRNCCYSRNVGSSTMSLLCGEPVSTERCRPFGDRFPRL